MRVSLARVARLCREQGTTTSAALAAAGVSRNAFYSLARRESVLPRSLRALAARLGVSPVEVLTEDDAATDAMRALIASAQAIARRGSRTDRDNIRHTLLLLREKPVDRLRRALARAPA